MGLRDGIRRLGRCPRGHLRWIVGIAALATVLPLLIRFLSLPRLLDVLTPKATRRPEAPDPSTMVRYTDRILGTRLWIYQPTCLKRALLLFHFLRRSGMPVSFCLGVQPTITYAARDREGRLEGHAWVTYEGRPVYESEKNRNAGYKPTFLFPRPHADEAAALDTARSG